MIRIEHVSTHIDGYVCMNMDENMKFHNECERESDGDHDDIYIYIYRMNDIYINMIYIHTSAESGGGTWRSGRACQGSPHPHTYSTQCLDPPFFQMNQLINIHT